MKKTDIFFRLTQSNFKRSKHYIVSIVISVAIVLAVCSVSAFIISKNIYKEDIMEKIKVGYYIPEDDDQKYNNFAINMLQDMNSIKSTAMLIQVDTENAGHEMLEKGEILYLIVVPDNFFSSILDGTNKRLDIYVKDNSTISAYIANELFLSYARYLSVAQAGIYSFLDTMWAHDVSNENINALQKNVNMTFVNRSLSKDSSIETIIATSEGSFTLLQHYLAVAVMLTLFFSAFVLMPYLQGYGPGLQKRLSSHKLNNSHIFLSNFICTLPLIYIGFVLSFIAVSIVTKTFNPIGLVASIPALILISLIINIISSLSNSIFSANMLTLVITIVLAYIGGGILPSAMLPNAIQSLSNYLPGEFIINNLAAAIFGI